MIELTDDQVRLLNTPGGAPPRLRDPRTGETFVLLRVEEYQRLTAKEYDDSPWTREVVLVRFPHPSGLRGKRRPAVVVQADAYSGVVGTLVAAEVAGNLTMAGDPACVFIDVTTPEGQATGLARDSVVSSSRSRPCTLTPSIRRSVRCPQPWCSNSMAV